MVGWLVPLILLGLIAGGSYVALHSGLIDVEPLATTVGNATQTAKDIGSTELAQNSQSAIFSFQDVINNLLVKYNVEPMRFWFMIVLIIGAIVWFMARIDAWSRIGAILLFLFAVAMLVL